MTSSSTTGAPTRRPAADTSSTHAVPGTITAPRTTWSRTHGWLSVERRPVNTHSSRSPSCTAAAIRGCSTRSRPAAVTSPP